MFSLSSSNNYLLYGSPCDMRKSFDALCGLVRGELGRDPLSGEVFVFLNKGRTHLKLLHGNPGKRGITPGEPNPARRAPTCPSHLCPPAKAEWKRLAAQLIVLRILTELDRAALAAYCQAYGRWVEAERKLHETPILLMIPSGYVQQNPWLTIANKQLELMHKY